MLPSPPLGVVSGRLIQSELLSRCPPQATATVSHGELRWLTWSTLLGLSGWLGRCSKIAIQPHARPLITRGYRCMRYATLELPVNCLITVGCCTWTCSSAALHQKREVNELKLTGRGRQRVYSSYLHKVAPHLLTPCKPNDLARRPPDPPLRRPSQFPTKLHSVQRSVACLSMTAA